MRLNEFQGCSFCVVIDPCSLRVMSLCCMSTVCPRKQINTHTQTHSGRYGFVLMALHFLVASEEATVAEQLSCCVWFRSEETINEWL